MVDSIARKSTIDGRHGIKMKSAWRAAVSAAFSA
jgi:hypothetical protein